MASTFVSGLAAATILTLFIVPVLWDMIKARQEKRPEISVIDGKLP
jgi:Cu/Ag efflux pump CusA